MLLICYASHVCAAGAVGSSAVQPHPVANPRSTQLLLAVVAPGLSTQALPLAPWRQLGPRVPHLAAAPVAATALVAFGTPAKPRQPGQTWQPGQPGHPNAFCPNQLA